MMGNPHRAYRDLVATTAIVNMRTDKAFRGVIWDTNRQLLTLRNVVLLEHGRETPVDGEVVIDTANVDFIQIVTA